MIVRRIGWFALIVLLVVSGFSAGQTEKRVALVIGNGAYEHVSPLANPSNDAEAVAAKLEGLGFSVTKAVDFQLSALRDALGDFERDSSGADVAIVFYAGHGLNLSGENYLLPVDARVESPGDLATAALRLSEIHAVLAAAQPELAVLILDACRNNPFVDKVSATQGLASGAVLGGELGRGENAAGVLIAFAAAPGAVAADGVDGNSPFTTALLQWIDRPGLEIGTMFRRVRQTVVELTDGAQVPWVEESLLRDAYLRPGELVQVAEAQAAPFDVALLTTIRQIENPTERRAAFAFYDRLLPDSKYAEADELRATNAAAGGVDAFTQHSLIWLSIRESEDPAIFQAFVDRFPDSAFVDLARLRLASIGGALGAEPPTLGEAADLVAPVDPTGPLVTGTVTLPGADSLAAAAPGGLVPPAAPDATPEPSASVPSPDAAEEALGLDVGQRIALQRLLAELGHLRGGLDGAIGPQSRQAIEAFQATSGLPVTGFVDRAFLRRLVQQAGPSVLASGIAGADRASLQGLAAVALRGAGATPVVVRFRTIDRHPPLQAYWRQLADNFEAAHPGVVVEMGSTPDAEYKRNMLVMLGSETPPDIFYTFGGGHLRSASEAGFARDLTPEMADGWAMQFKPGALENLTVDGRIYAVPMHMTIVSLWVNEPLLLANGIDPQSLRTWAGFLDAVNQLKRAGVTPLAVGGADRWPLQFYWGTLAHHLGGRAAFERAMAGEAPGFTDPAFVRAGTLLQELVKRDPFQPGFMDTVAQEAWDTFSRGEAAMILAGSWAVPRMTRMWPGGRKHGLEDIVRVDFPPDDLRQEGVLTYGGTPAWIVRRDAPEEAVEFLRLLSGLESQTTAAVMGYDVPSIAGADTAITDPLLGDVASKLTQSTHHQLFYDQALGPQAGEAVNDIVVALVEGDLTPEQAAAEVDAAWRRVGNFRTPDGSSVAPAQELAPVE